MKLQQPTDTFSTRSRGRRNRKRFYRALCCTDLHISESQSSVYSTTMATAKSRSYIPTTSGLTNELYFASHKPDGDNEKTPPVLLRNKPRSSHLQIIPTDNIQTTLNNRRPISSPVRSTTYVLQQHHRTNNSVTNNKKISSPAHQHRPPSLTTPMTLNKTRQTTQQQRITSNHERLPIQPASVVDSTTANQQFTSRAHTTVLTPRRSSPIVKNTSTKTTTAYISRSPRIPHTSIVRPSRPSHTVVTTPIQQRSPRVQIRSSNLTPASQRTISSSPTTNKSSRPQYTVSKSPEKLRSVTGIVTRLRPAHTIVNKSKLDNSSTSTNHLKSRTPNTVRTVSSSVATPRVSDLDALMAEKYTNNNKIPPSVQLKSTILFPTPIVNNIRRSLFSTDSVKVVRPVRSQELKLFSCHLTPDISTLAAPSDEIPYKSTVDETVSILTPIPPSEQITDHKNLDNQSIAKIDDSSSIATASTIIHDLSEDSLNEHYHIRKLLNG
ncbi:unnamed protein product, partial [Rotaria magnacalcarata]